MADQLCAGQAIGEEAEQEQEQRLQVSCQSDDLEELHVVAPSLDALDRPLDPTAQGLRQQTDVEVDAETAQEVYCVFGPSGTHMVDQDQMQQHGDHLDQKGSQDVSLCLQEGLSGVVEGEGVDGGHELIEIATHF